MPTAEAETDTPDKPRRFWAWMLGGWLLSLVLLTGLLLWPFVRNDWAIQELKRLNADYELEESLWQSWPEWLTTRLEQVGGTRLREACGRVDFVAFSGKSIVDADLICLRALSGLTGLQLQNTGITGTGLQHLRTRDLQYFYSTGDNFNNTGIAYLTQQTELEQIWLESTAIDDRGLEMLAKLPRLKYFTLWGERVTDVGLQHLTELPELSSLCIGGVKMTDVGLKHLTKLPKLDYLMLNDSEMTDARLMILTKINSLKRLDVTFTQVTAAGVSEFEKRRPDCQVSY